MEISFVIPVITGIIGVVAGAIPSYLSLKSKRMELEHSYRLNIEERHYKSSRDFIEILYKPIYKIIIKLENLMEDKSKEAHDYKQELNIILSEFDDIKNRNELIYLK